jgi:hypothetical protein
VNSPGAVERRDLLLSTKPVRADSSASGGPNNNKLDEERHVHKKGGLRKKIDQQRRNVRGIQGRLRRIEAESGARKRRTLRGNKDAAAATITGGEVLSEPYRRKEILEASNEGALQDLVDRLKGMSEEELRAVHGETERLLALAQESLAEIEKDFESVQRWERFESGFETRDVLANGERRVHMELRYGREVTVEDVDSDLRGMTTEQRKRALMEGIAKDQSHDRRLPGPLNVNRVFNLLES